MLNNFSESKKGFTLIELLITILVFTTGILGIYLVIQRLFASADYAKERVIAIYLAQEGVEIVRNIRDSNWLENTTWDDGLPSGSNFGVQYNRNHLLSGYGDKFLKIDNNGFYNYFSGQETKFKRKINIQKIDDHTLKIKVEVSWSERFSPVILEAKIYDWLP